MINPYADISEFGILAKLIRLCKLALSNHSSGEYCRQCEVELYETTA